jgi:hypothetical protein
LLGPNELVKVAVHQGFVFFRVCSPFRTITFWTIGRKFWSGEMAAHPLPFRTGEARHWPYTVAETRVAVRRRIVLPIKPKPNSIIAHMAGSGTALVVPPVKNTPEAELKLRPWGSGLKPK